MTTATFIVAPEDAPVGAVCRIYHKDTNEALGEIISDGSGVLVFPVDPDWLSEIQLETVVTGVDGVRTPPVLKVTIE